MKQTSRMVAVAMITVCCSIIVNGATKRLSPRVTMLQNIASLTSKDRAIYQGCAGSTHEPASPNTQPEAHEFPHYVKAEKDEEALYAEYQKALYVCHDALIGFTVANFNRLGITTPASHQVVSASGSSISSSSAASLGSSAAGSTTVLAVSASSQKNKKAEYAAHAQTNLSSLAAALQPAVSLGGSNIADLVIAPRVESPLVNPQGSPRAAGCTSRSGEEGAYSSSGSSTGPVGSCLIAAGIESGFGSFNIYTY